MIYVPLHQDCKFRAVTTHLNRFFSALKSVVGIEVALAQCDGLRWDGTSLKYGGGGAGRAKK